MAFGRSRIVVSVLALAVIAGLSSDRIVAAGAKGDRTISFYHIHTNERITVTYKKDGVYVPDALKKIDWIMRDWRKNEAIRIDPATIDLAWEMHEELGSREPISIICGYRSQGTNEKLRRTVGGQASQSHHITGKAIDITFPDVPLKRMRYSALIRERGGVGYYPTSGIPFVHVDTARVRSWPRLPRYELALVFPEGRSRHMPADGGPITPSDVRVAQTKYRELAVQIAEFHDSRKGLRSPTLVASAAPAPAAAARPATGTIANADAPRAPRYAVASLGGGPVPEQPAAQAARKIDLKWESLEKTAAPRPAGTLNRQLASLAPEQSAVSAPKLITEPKIVERASRFTPSKNDRGKLDVLFKQAAAMPEPKLVAGPKPAQRPQKQMAAAAVASGDLISALIGQPPVEKTAGLQLASLAPEKNAASITDMSPDALGNGWVQAPEFDEDHPEELAYRPFPLAPLLTETSSAHDPSLAGTLQHPDVAATLDMIDDIGAIAPMKFRPGQQVAQVMWAQQFQGKAVYLDALKEIEQGRMPAGLENRQVRTTAR